MTALTFQAALEKLVRSPSYREAVANSGQRLKTDYALGDEEFETMRQVAVATGWIKNEAAATTACCCCCCPRIG
jgi:hypothetical protein